MLQNDKGYLAITGLYAFSIYIFVMLFLLPSLLTIHKEQLQFEENRMMMHLLHSELQYVIWDSTTIFPTSYSKIHEQNHIFFTFKQETNLIKGCVKWENKRKKESQECFYAKTYD
ncbi:hypothetical protein GLW08_09350 [Pontibacillus yanchengensis]|uniref:Competence protein ComG n=2 Tax=Pontibacillus yanchengensis TaxID=462910 RepID=A0A6I5A3J8_9BACI|nr:hypothetical protein [Pontibacillus yanchengensis]MYL33489.1 hypothetical protein [Pontibacillus yanchengensis]MYL53539.1 hypothetical protein [Pontibacillus yanchengensis]